MGFIGWTGRQIKRETLYVAGGEGISGWWHAARTSWLSTKRRCPVCGEGRLFPFAEPVNGILRDFYGCSRCEHFEVADLTNEKDEVVAESLGRLRGLVKERVGGLSVEEEAALKQRLKSNCRLQYFLSMVLLGAGTYLFIQQGSAWYLMNATGLAMLLFAHGLRSSYRHWQVCNNVFYQPGSFRSWIGLGQWLI